MHNIQKWNCTEEWYRRQDVPKLRGGSQFPGRTPKRGKPTRSEGNARGSRVRRKLRHFFGLLLDIAETWRLLPGFGRERSTLLNHDIGDIVGWGSESRYRFLDRLPDFDGAEVLYRSQCLLQGAEKGYSVHVTVVG